MLRIMKHKKSKKNNIIPTNQASLNRQDKMLRITKYKPEKI